MESEGGVQAEGGDGGGLPTPQSWRETLCGPHTPSPSQHAFRICKRTWELRGELVFAASSERSPGRQSRPPPGSCAALSSGSSCPVSCLTPMTLPSRISCCLLEI